MKIFKPNTTFIAIAGMAVSSLFLSCEAEEQITETQNLKNDSSVLQESQSQAISGQYIVTLNEAASRSIKNDDSYKGRLANVNAFVNEMIAAPHMKSTSVKQVYGFAMTGFTATLSPEQLKSLQSDSRVASVEPDVMVKLSVAKEETTAMTFVAQNTPYGITRVNGGVDGTGKTAWIIDSGIDLDHPDLNVDVDRSRSFVPGEPSPDDQNGHGSHVAGTVAAIDNGIGVIGVAPNAKVVALKVLGADGSGATSGIIAALDYVAAVGEPGDAANMSLGPAVPILGINSALDNATTRVGAKGIGVAIAAGNSTSIANLYSPARASGENVYTVSAMDSNDQFAYFSNFGSVVDYCAPGVSVYSTSMQGGYATLSGTSMAAPHVCGLLLLGDLRTDGNVFLDPDFNPDPIAVH
ncbi:S8 family serine peptidase [Croceibacter atlanticus]|jgi:subtilisin family serine protease|uniref:Extracellular alkaline serine protease n=3 Tax=Croceibacter TaxID=216431 RepID=A3U4E4_CROAH|nr:S8 family serine peptidase [Croceibacter atlanticus]EAP87111.1 extracellular alkaline serine protease [Croceibacter atlanticus HTCC2559]MBW4971400.1 S8 family serine peptidase [Croceibacter atlanticus]